MNYTKIRRATSFSDSLESTIPHGIVRFLELKQGDILLWELHKDRKIVVKKDDLELQIKHLEKKEGK